MACHSFRHNCTSRQATQPHVKRHNWRRGRYGECTRLLDEEREMREPKHQAAKKKQVRCNAPWARKFVPGAVESGVELPEGVLQSSLTCPPGVNTWVARLLREGCALARQATQLQEEEVLEEEEAEALEQERGEEKEVEIRKMWFLHTDYGCSDNLHTNRRSQK